MTIRSSDLSPQQRAAAGLPVAATKKLKPSYGGYLFDSKTEAEYARHLEHLKLLSHDEVTLHYYGRASYGGRIDWWEYSPIKIKLGERCWLTIDFFVKPMLGPIEAHEVKGFMRDDAAVKLKVVMPVIRRFGWRLIIVRKRNGGGWDFEERE